MRNCGIGRGLADDFSLLLTQGNEQDRAGAVRPDVNVGGLAQLTHLPKVRTCSAFILYDRREPEISYADLFIE
jgi:hypothetical protein